MLSGIPLTVSGISLTHNPKETRVAYAVQYEDFFFKRNFTYGQWNFTYPKWNFTYGKWNFND